MNDTRPVAERFEFARAELFKQTGREPTHCHLSLDLARRAAQEHQASRRVEPMFQSWHPTAQFVVRAGEDTLTVSVVLAQGS